MFFGKCFLGIGIEAFGILWRCFRADLAEFGCRFVPASTDHFS
jgi:hypothetical protein